MFFCSWLKIPTLFLPCVPSQLITPNTQSIKLTKNTQVMKYNIIYCTVMEFLWVFFCCMSNTWTVEMTFALIQRLYAASDLIPITSLWCDIIRIVVIIFKTVYFGTWIVLTCAIFVDLTIRGVSVWQYLIGEWETLTQGTEDDWWTTQCISNNI